MRDDSMVWEWYAPDHDAEMRHYSASLAKGVVGGLSFAVAMEDGRIAADDPASKYIASWAHDSVRSRITVRHLATHSSGIEDAEIPGSSLSHTDLPGWKGAFWQRRQPEKDGLDPFSIAVYQAPILFEPGSDYAYSNPGMAALSYAVTASLSERTDIRSLLRDRIMRPIGIEDDEWSIG